MLQIVDPKNLWTFLQIAVLKYSFCKLIIKENILWQWIKYYYKLLQWIIFSKFGKLNIPVNVIFANLCFLFQTGDQDDQVDSVGLGGPVVRMVKPS